MEEGLELRKHSNYFFVGSFVLIIFASIIVLWPFISAVVASIVLAFVIYPVYNFILKYLKNKTLSSLITSLLVLIIILLPFIFLGTTILNEATKFFYSVQNVNLETLKFDFIDNYFGNNIDIGSFIKEGLSKLSITLVQGAHDFVINIPQKILELFIIFFVMFYLLIDGKKLV